MKYSIGDRLVYPLHGAGVVESIEERYIDEKKYYYVMRMPVGNVKIMVPVASSESVGVRDVITVEKANEVLAHFKDVRPDVTSNWNRRYRENMDKIKNGNILDTAYVVKTLMLKEKMKGLSLGERKMLGSTRQVLISELVIALGKTQEAVEEEMKDIVAADLVSLGFGSAEEETAEEAALA